MKEIYNMIENLNMLIHDWIESEKEEQTKARYGVISQALNKIMDEVETEMARHLSDFRCDKCGKRDDKINMIKTDIQGHYLCADCAE